MIKRFIRLELDQTQSKVVRTDRGGVRVVDVIETEIQSKPRICLTQVHTDARKLSAFLSFSRAVGRWRANLLICPP